MFKVWTHWHAWNPLVIPVSCWYSLFFSVCSANCFRQSLISARLQHIWKRQDWGEVTFTIFTFFWVKWFEESGQSSLKGFLCSFSLFLAAYFLVDLFVASPHISIYVPSLFLSIFFLFPLFSSPEHEVLSKLLWSFNVRRPAFVRARVNNFFKQHLLWNR